MDFRCAMPARYCHAGWNCLKLLRCNPLERIFQCLQNLPVNYVQHFFFFSFFRFLPSSNGHPRANPDGSPVRVYTIALPRCRLAQAGSPTNRHFFQTAIQMLIPRRLLPEPDKASGLMVLSVDLSSRNSLYCWPAYKNARQDCHRFGGFLGGSVHSHCTRRCRCWKRERER